MSPGNNHDLDRSFVNSIAWSAIAKWGAQIASWSSTIFVARLLSPDDYGIIGLAAIFLGVAQILNELGIGTTILIHRDLNNEQISQLNGLAVLMGTATTLITVLVAPAMGAFFTNTEVPNVLRALSLILLFGGFRSVPRAVMQRDLRFKQTALIEGIASVAGAASALALAFAGGKYWALVGSQLVMGFLNMAQILWVNPLQLTMPKLRTIRSAFVFSNRVLAERLSWHIYANAPHFLLGKIHGATALGLYSFSWNLMGTALDRLATLVNGVTPAYLSNMKDNREGLQRLTCGISEILTIILFPVTAGIALVAPEAVPLVFGTKWLPAVPVVQVLAGYCMLETLRPVLIATLLNVGESQFVMWVGLVSAVVFPIGFYLASPFGVTAIAAVWLPLHPFVLAAMLLRLFSLGTISPRIYFRALSPAVQGTLIMALVVLVLKNMASGNFLRGQLLALLILAGAVAYSSTLLLLHRQRITQLAQFGRRMIRR